MGCGLSKGAAARAGEDEAKTVDTATSTEDLSVPDPSAPPAALPDPTNQTTPEGNTAVPTVPPAKQCSVCYESKDWMITPCFQCSCVMCRDCLRTMFTRATTDPYSMPPRCCAPINLGLAMPCLTSEETERFKAKLEEYMTVAPFYCPAQDCSTFIPYRLWPAEKRPVRRRESSEEPEENDTTETEDDVKEEPAAPPPPAINEEPKMVTVACPKCFCEICCDCKRLSHPGAACAGPNSVVDEEFAETLKKLKIRQCPKCAAGVRRMFGCNQILCRCGSHWCFSCGKFSSMCRDEGCDANYNTDDEDDDYDDYDEPAPTTEPAEPGAADPPQDLDAGGRDVWDNGVYDFGEEQDSRRTEPWNCNHSWKPKARTLPRNANYCCENCWRTVSAHSGHYPEAAVLLETGRFPDEAAVSEDGSSTSGSSHSGQASEETNSTAAIPTYSYCNRCYRILCAECHSELKA